MERDHDGLRRLFDLAIAAPVVERGALLLRECRGDIALLNRVEAMIAAAEDERFLGRPTAAPLADLAVDATVDTPRPSAEIGRVVAAVLGEGPGSRIGPYKLLQLIGEGGFGSVFMADQQTPVVRKVALKIIKLGMDTRQVIARFEAERQALAMMDHPNIAKIFDAGATETGRPYFVMELCTGDPIVTYCDKQYLSIAERLELFAQVCQAVQHAHTKGVIHRDLKPSNILVATQDGKPHEKVIDFGIAKATNSKLTERTFFTEHRQLVGTLEYMSPEQAEGNLDIDTRTDVYSLGVLLYELLTGTTPIGRVDLPSSSFGEIQRMIIEVDPPKPSTRLSQSTDTLAAVAAARRSEPRKLSAVVRGELDWIVMKALEKDRRRRYETANSFAADVRRYLNGDAVVAAPPSKLYQFRKFVRRHKGVAAAAALLLVAIVGLTAALFAVNRERMRAENALASEEAARTRTRQALDDMTSQVMENWMARQQKLDTAQKAFLEKALASYEDFAREPSQSEKTRRGVADAYSRVGRIHYKLGRAEGAEAAFRRTVDLFEALANEFPAQPELRKQLAGSHQNLGVLLADTGRSKLAEQCYGKALEVRKRLVEDLPAEPGYHQDLAINHILLGNLSSERGQQADAEAAFQEAIGIQKKLAADFPNEWKYRRDLAITYFNLGITLNKLNRFKESEAAYRDSLSIRRQQTDEFPADPEHRQAVAATLHNLALLLRTTGRMKEAEQGYRESLAMDKRLADEFPAMAAHRANLSRTYGDLAIHLATTDQPQQAETAFRAAIALEKQLVADHPDVPVYRKSLAKSLRNLGVFLYEGNHLPESEAAYRESLDTTKKLAADFPSIPVYRSDAAEVLFNLALLLERVGRRQDAEASYRDCIAMEKQLVEEFPAVPRHRFILAAGHGGLAALLRNDRMDEAEAAYREALSVQQKLVENSPQVTDYRLQFSVLNRSYGNVLKDANRPSEASEVLAAAKAIQEKLISEFADVSKYRFERALTLHALAELQRDTGKYSHAHVLLEQAKPDLDAALKANPDGPNYRQTFRAHESLRAQVAAGAGDQEVALRTAEEIAKLGWDPAADAYGAACALGRCAHVISIDSNLPEADRSKQSIAFNDRSVQMLTEAIAKGFKDLENLRKAKDLATLHSREDFQKLVNELEGKSAPATEPG